MDSITSFTPLENPRVFSWRVYLLDTMLAVIGIGMVTGIIDVFRLYPRIPNISIIYLLVVLVLASVRGRYASILAAVIAFLSFDFFIVPPLFTFVIYHAEEWIALFVFLVTAILTSHLAVMLHQRAQEARSHSQETAILYDLVRVTNNEDQPERQLQRIAQAVVKVFSSWGVSDCTVLQIDEDGTVHMQASAYQLGDQPAFSKEEEAIIAWIIEHGCAMELDDDVSPAPAPAAQFLRRFLRPGNPARAWMRHYVQFIPLKSGKQIVGILRLQVQSHYRLSIYSGPLQRKYLSSRARVPFFDIFLDQITSLVEHIRLRSDALHMELLQRTDELRAALLASVSHDLRTPLTAIKAAASSLLQEEVDWDNEARQSFAHSIEREADRLNRLVGNLLDMSRIEGGALKPEKEWYPLTVLVRDVLSRLQPLLRGRSVFTSLPEDLTTAELDYVQIEQVLTNLLENAVRYTPPEAPIEVSVQFNEAEVLLCVADGGPGIPAADLERVFDKFYRVLGRQPQAGYSSGSGLGLAICKGIIEAHQGRIWAEARPGGGVIFSIAFPVDRVEGRVA